MAKITFFYPSYENIGIEYLSSYLRQFGHEAELVFYPFLENLFETFPVAHLFKKNFTNIEKLVASLLKNKPDLIGFSVTSDIYNLACTVARELKKKSNIPIIFGGIHPTSVPEHVIKEDFVDFICIGEGEKPLKELLDYLDLKRKDFYIENIWFKDNDNIIKNKIGFPIANLDDLPFPDKDIFFSHYSGFSHRYTILTGRGCPFYCTYCCNNTMKKIYGGFRVQALRRRSVENVIEELSIAKKRYHLKSISFFDEIFTYDINWLKEFMPQYNKKIRVPFWCNGYPSMLNAEIIDLLMPHCQTLYIGFGTYSEAIREKVLKRTYSNKKLSELLKFINKTNIFLIIDMILGLPDQNEEELLNIVNFFKEHQVDNLTISILRYYPNTEIVDIAKNRQILGEDQISMLNTLDFHGRIKMNPKDTSLVRKISLLIFLTQRIPAKIIKLIKDKRLYLLLPAFEISTNDNINILLSTLKGFLKNKRRIPQRYGSTVELLRFFIYFFKTF